MLGRANAAVILIALWHQPAMAVDWQVRRNVSNGACSVQRADSQPPLGRLLSQHPNRPTACKEAGARYAPNEPGNTEKCLEYTRGSRMECKADGIDLP